MAPPAPAVKVPAAPLATGVKGPAVPALPQLKMSTPLLGTVITALFYLSSFLFITFLILTFINFTVYPIFKLSPYDQGVLSVYTNENQQKAWVDKPATTSAVLTNPVSTDYTISLDIFVPTDYSAATEPRVVLYRGDTEATIPANTKASNLSSVITSNIIVYIDSDKNDMVVAVKTNKGIQIITKLTNVKMGAVFRLTIVYMPNYMEVYMDGKLIATKNITGTPIESLTPFWPPTKNTGNTVKVGNLYYWGRALLANEIQGLLPVAPTSFFLKSS
jgi:hypothetical protein